MLDPDQPWFEAEDLLPEIWETEQLVHDLGEPPELEDDIGTD